MFWHIVFAQSLSVMDLFVNCVSFLGFSSPRCFDTFPEVLMCLSHDLCDVQID